MSVRLTDQTVCLGQNTSLRVWIFFRRDHTNRGVTLDSPRGGGGGFLGKFKGGFLRQNHWFSCTAKEKGLPLRAYQFTIVGNENHKEKGQ
ncbi:hypothetical protein HWC63_gp136 [Erwinia phage pEp_SNUABM_01]|uniref:Uncharacterized protein n=1 Tax=Erwinia phage pEp_SNUABM_01 TaxID=2601643 RepID=A0A5J6DAX4_9CAUD|nr:hypothetical protein HWC63_gp136 [Erwinia phage pEp_SNUABM_01]QEQ95042.1 hypothetical protein pEpSNUABM01_216 [Erwinia phage pEp_SNUABM_01]